MDFRLFFQKYYRVPLLVIAILGLLMVVYIRYPHTDVTKSSIDQNKQSFLTATPIQQAPFTIISSAPQQNQEQVNAGEITILLKTNVPVLSKESIQADIIPQPPTPGYMEINNLFPTSTIQLKIFGGLAPDTSYTVSLKSLINPYRFTLKFRTENKIGESSSGLVVRQDEAYKTQYYPLLNVVPYNAPGWSIDYTDKLTLQVTILASEGPGSSKLLDTFKTEVNNWIRSKGVNPATHTINYIDQRNLGNDAL